MLHWVALLTPGPNTLVISNLAAGGSRRAAVFAALGITVVAGLWSFIAVIGVNAIFTAQPYLRLIVQFAGGGYLIYVGLRFWRAGRSSPEITPLHLTSFSAFRIGLFTNILNPKAVLFFSSVFSAALPADSPELLLGLSVIIVVVNAFAWHAFLAVALSHARVQAAYARGRRTIGRTAGILVGIFGMRLIIAAVTQLRAR
jgi:threonine efflux protein